MNPLLVGVQIDDVNNEEKLISFFILTEVTVDAKPL